MIGKLVLAALVAGLLAGLIYGGVQHVRTTPLILAAEVYEKAGAPADGWQRTLSTFVASMIAGAGFAILLAGVSLITGLPITRGNGVIWGLCGFLAVVVAPSAGLSPQLPGMPEADLVARQIWWVATALSTGAGLFLIATRAGIYWVAAALILIAVPHIFGAPQPLNPETAVPAALASSFVANSIAASAILWSLIGTFLGFAMQKFGKDLYPS